MRKGLILLLMAGLLWGVAAAQPDEALETVQLYYKLVDVGRSFESDVDYKQSLVFFNEVCADAEALWARQPSSAVRGKIEQIIGIYKDVYTLWGEAEYAREDGEDALFRNSRRYKALAERYPGLFEKLTADNRYGQMNERIFYLKKTIAKEINAGFAVKQQVELKQVLFPPEKEK